MKPRHIAYALALFIVSYSMGDCACRKHREERGLIDAKFESVNYPVATVPETNPLIREIMEVRFKNPNTYQSWPKGVTIK